MADWGRCWEGSQAWTDGVRSEEGWRPSHGGKSAAAGRLAAPRERRLEEGEPSGHIHLALGAVAPGSCWKMKNYTALIRLHYTTSDYMRLTPVQKKQKKRERARERRRWGGRKHT